MAAKRGICSVCGVPHAPGDIRVNGLCETCKDAQRIRNKLHREFRSLRRADVDYDEHEKQRRIERYAQIVESGGRLFE